MSSFYTDTSLTSLGYRVNSENSDFFLNLQVDNPKKNDLLIFNGLVWKPINLIDLRPVLVLEGGSASSSIPADTLIFDAEGA